MGQSYSAHPRQHYRSGPVCSGQHPSEPVHARTLLGKTKCGVVRSTYVLFCFLILLYYTTHTLITYIVSKRLTHSVHEFVHYNTYAPTTFSQKEVLRLIIGISVIIFPFFSHFTYPRPAWHSCSFLYVDVMLFVNARPEPKREGKCFSM